MPVTFQRMPLEAKYIVDMYAMPSQPATLQGGDINALSDERKTVTQTKWLESVDRSAKMRIAEIRKRGWQPHVCRALTARDIANIANNPNLPHLEVIAKIRKVLENNCHIQVRFSDIPQARRTLVIDAVLGTVIKPMHWQSLSLIGSGLESGELDRAHLLNMLKSAALLNQLTGLILRNVGINQIEMEWLVQILSASLTELDLTGNTFRDRGSRMLADAIAAKKIPLVTLTLQKSHDLSEVGMARIAYALPSTLRHLDVSHNSIGGRWMRALPSTVCASLISLKMRGNNFVCGHNLDLAALPKMTSLQILDLGETNLCASNGAMKVVVSKFPPSLRMLGLTNNWLRDEDAILLAKDFIPRTTSLTLHLGFNEINDKGARELFAALIDKGIPITNLTIDNNKLSSTYQKKLSSEIEFLKKVNLIKMHMTGYRVNDEKAKTLVAALEKRGIPVIAPNPGEPDLSDQCKNALDEEKEKFLAGVYMTSKGWWHDALKGMGTQDYAQSF